MFGSRARGDASPRCRRGQHRLRTDRLLLCHPTVSDLRVAAAAASDRLAQGWLGWRPEQVIAEGLCAGLLAQRAGGGFHWAPIDSGWLIAVDTASGRIAGAVTVTGPALHRLPNGRTVHSQWFRHDTDEPRYCR